MRFGLLGALEVRDEAGNALDPGGSKARLLLTVLLLADGATVGGDRLVEVLWGGAPPPGTSRRQRRPVKEGSALVASTPASVIHKVSPSNTQLVGAPPQAMKPSTAPLGAGTWMPPVMSVT